MTSPSSSSRSGRARDSRRDLARVRPGFEAGGSLGRDAARVPRVSRRVEAQARGHLRHEGRRQGARRRRVEEGGPGRQARARRVRRQLVRLVPQAPRLLQRRTGRSRRRSGTNTRSRGSTSATSTTRNQDLVKSYVEKHGGRSRTSPCSTRPARSSPTRRPAPSRRATTTIRRRSWRSSTKWRVARARTPTRFSPTGWRSAKAESKMVFFHVGAPWCGWCHKLEAFLANEEIARILAADFVMLKIDQDRMTHGKEVGRRIAAEARRRHPLDRVPRCRRQEPRDLGRPDAPRAEQHRLPVGTEGDRLVHGDARGRSATGSRPSSSIALEAVLRKFAENAPARARRRPAVEARATRSAVRVEPKARPAAWP